MNNVNATAFAAILKQRQQQQQHHPQQQYTQQQPHAQQQLRQQQQLYPQQQQQYHCPQQQNYAIHSPFTQLSHYGAAVQQQYAALGWPSVSQPSMPAAPPLYSWPQQQLSGLGFSAGNGHIRGKGRGRGRSQCRPASPVAKISSTSYPNYSSVYPPTPTMMPYPLQSTAPQQQQVWYCEPCDKEFTVATSYEAHCATHEQCQHPNCQFVASKKVVIAHYHSSHGQFSGSGYKTIDVEGQKFRVLLGTSPEEVQQWRQERKARFPTIQNQQLKQQQQQELREAGGIVNSSKAKRINSTVLGKRTASEAVDDSAKEAESSALDPSPSADLSTTNGNAMQSKRCIYYGRGKCKSGDNCQYSHDFEPQHCQFFLRGHCKNGSRCYNLHDHSTRKQSKDKTRNNIGTSNTLHLPEPVSNSQLLRKLLKDEIVAEENLILQCLRFLVQHDFLQNDGK